MIKQITKNIKVKPLLATLCVLQAFAWPSADVVPFAAKPPANDPQYAGAGMLPPTPVEWRQRLMLRGIYNGKTLVIKNPYNDEKGYCVSAIVVNGALNESIVNTHEFEIDPGSYGIKPGEEVDIMIEHSRDCIPTITNPEVLK